MRAYGLAYRDTMQLPVKVFWQLSGTVPQLLAGEQKDLLELLTTATHNPEQASELHHNLSVRAPDPVTLTVQARIEATSVRDEAGFDKLKRLAG